jgi:thiamine biosynthesis lipoprotein
MQLVAEDTDPPWHVGIADPRDPSRVLTVVTGRNLAVATSGTAERGSHIIDPFTGAPVAPGYLSATAVGPSLTRADAYATAAFVMGRHALQWANSRPGYEVLLVDASGRTSASRGWREATTLAA